MALFLKNCIIPYWYHGKQQHINKLSQKNDTRKLYSERQGDSGVWAQEHSDRDCVSIEKRVGEFRFSVGKKQRLLFFA